jgi:hypothetical protein
MPLKPLAEIEDMLRRADLPAAAPMALAVLRNVVVEPIEPYLRYLALEIGHNATVRFGAYDQVYQEAVGGRPDLLDDNTACVLIFVSLDVLSWNLARNFAALGSGDVPRAVAQIGTSSTPSSLVSAARRPR